MYYHNVRVDKCTPLMSLCIGSWPLHFTKSCATPGLNLCQPRVIEMEQPTPFPFGKGSSPQDAREQKSPSRPRGVMNRVAGLFRPKQTDGKENLDLPCVPLMKVNYWRCLRSTTTPSTLHNQYPFHFAQPQLPRGSWTPIAWGTPPL